MWSCDSLFAWWCEMDAPIEDCLKLACRFKSWRLICERSMWVEELLNFLNSSSSMAQYLNVRRRKLGILSIQTVHILRMIVRSYCYTTVPIEAAMRKIIRIILSVTNTRHLTSRYEPWVQKIFLYNNHAENENEETYADFVILYLNRKYTVKGG